MRTEIISILISSEHLSATNRDTKLKPIAEWLHSTYSDYEIVVVHSPKTHERNIEIQDLTAQFKSCRVLQLAFPMNTDQTYAIGLDFVIGDFVILYDPSSQPFDLVINACEHLEDLPRDATYIVGSPKRNFRFSQAFRNWSYAFILGVIKCSLKGSSSSFRVICRSQLNLTLKSTFPNHYLFFRLDQVGFKAIYSEYSEERTQSPGLISGFSKFLSLLVNNSDEPLKWCIQLGLLASLVSLALAGYGLMSKVLSNSVISGWSSLMVMSSFLFSILFLITVFFAQYLKRIVNQNSTLSQSAPVVGEIISNTQIEYDRLNVEDQSE